MQCIQANRGAAGRPRLECRSILVRAAGDSECPSASIAGRNLKFSRQSCDAACAKWNEERAAENSDLNSALNSATGARRGAPRSADT